MRGALNTDESVAAERATGELLSSFTVFPSLSLSAYHSLSVRGSTLSFSLSLSLSLFLFFCLYTSSVRPKGDEEPVLQYAFL